MPDPMFLETFTMEQPLGAGQFSFPRSEKFLPQEVCPQIAQKLPHWDAIRLQAAHQGLRLMQWHHSMRRVDQNAEFLTTQKGNNISNYGISQLAEFYKPGMKVLDIGAGNNLIDFDGLTKFDMFEYQGVDAIGDSENLPFADESFDMIVSLAVLEHVQDPDKMADEIFRITKRSGRIFILTAFIQWEHSYPYHYFNFSQHGLRQVFKKFKEIECGPSPYTSLSQLTLIILELNKHIQDPHIKGFVDKIMEKEKEIMQTDSYKKIYPSVHFYGEKV